MGMCFVFCCQYQAQRFLSDTGLLIITPLPLRIFGLRIFMFAFIIFNGLKNILVPKT